MTSTMQAEAFEAFRDMGGAEDKALKAASVLGKREDDFTEAVADLTLDNVSIKGELSTLRWMVGFHSPGHPRLRLRPGLSREVREVSDDGRERGGNDDPVDRADASVQTVTARDVRRGRSPRPW